MSSLLGELNITKKASEQIVKEASTDEIYKEDFYPLGERPDEGKPSPRAGVRQEINRGETDADGVEVVPTDMTPKFSDADNFTKNF